MDLKSDGRMYSRISRRSVAIISHIHEGRIFTINEIAVEIHNKRLPEFFLERFQRQMSVSRTRDYVRYLRDLEVIGEQEDGYILKFRHRDRDGEWAQALSDRALPHLAKRLKRSPEKTPDFLERRLRSFYRRRQLPTVDAMTTDLGIEGGRSEETFKWSLYIYADGGTCPFDIRRYPVLLKRSA